MKSVFLLWHIHTISNKESDTKLLGVYSNRDAAELKIEKKYKLLPGFSDTDGEFTIDEYVLDKNHWEEGYTTE